MREIKARHVNGESEDEVTIVDVLLKANDDVYVVYIDPEGKIDGDEANKFTACEALHELSNG